MCEREREKERARERIKVYLANELTIHTTKCYNRGRRCTLYKI